MLHHHHTAVVHPMHKLERSYSFLLEAMQACVDRLSSRAQWVRDQYDGWTWLTDRVRLEGGRSGAEEQTCQLVRAAEQSRWIVVVGDSRGRMVYAALLTMLNETKAYKGEELQYGWPTHRVHSNSICTAHVPRAPLLDNNNESHGWRREAWGWYNPQCQARWKGPCWDDARAQYPKHACALDYTVAATTVRLTFIWHARNHHSAHRELLASRIRMLLVDAARAPDLLLVSTGLWDMQICVLAPTRNRAAAPCVRRFT